jgi:hypothetical protein
MNTNLALSKESLVTLAIEAFEKGQKKSLRAAALALGAPINLTYKRYNGRVSKAEQAPNNRKLTDTEETAIEQWILSLDRRGFSPNLAMVADMANLLLAQRNPPVVGNLAVVGKHWVTNFVKRHKTLKSKLSRCLDYERALCNNPVLINKWFQRVEATIQEYGIATEDIYNFDETGFQMGAAATCKVVTSARTRGRPSVTQPGDTEWVTIVECINALGWTLPPMVILAGKVHISTWYDEGTFPGNWKIALSDTGWTNDELGLYWIKEVFDPNTINRTVGQYRLLILDGHGSHNTPEFDQYCKENNIVLLCMPAHSSHLLQPLDVGIFSPLKRVYRQGIDTNMRLGINHIDKQEFLRVYPLARASAFTASNIHGAFRGAGLIPLDPAVVLEHLKVKSRLLTPDNLAPNEPIVLQTPQNISQLQHHTAVVLESLRNRSHSPGSPEQLIIEQLCKSAEIAMHTAALIASTNESLIAANTRLTRKQAKKRSYIASGGVLTGEEGAILAKEKSAPKPRKKPNKVTKSGNNRQSTVQSTGGFLNWVRNSIL